jgi:RNA polymerase sigma-70 factor (sigma-E family)
VNTGAELPGAAPEREVGMHRSQLSELFIRYAPEGVRLAYLLTGDRAVAEDLVQEAFVRMVSRLQFLREGEGSRAYLRRTIVNLSKNHYRRRAIERSHLETQSGEPLAESLDTELATQDLMRAALLALPERQRCAIVLRYYEDLPDVEIANILHCRPGTVRSLISRGLAVLRGVPEVTG